MSDFKKPWGEHGIFGSIALKDSEGVEPDAFHEWFMGLGWQVKSVYTHIKVHINHQMTCQKYIKSQDGYLRNLKETYEKKGDKWVLKPKSEGSDVSKPKDDSKEEVKKLPSGSAEDGDASKPKDDSKEEVKLPETREENKLVWTGPEADPRLLDIFIWKPLDLLGPSLVRKAEAQKTVDNMIMGRPKEMPKEHLPKRSYLREESYVDKIPHHDPPPNGAETKSRSSSLTPEEIVRNYWKPKSNPAEGTRRLQAGKVTVKFNPNTKFEHNIHATDWLTGVTTYQYDQRSKSNTDPLGQGELDKAELIKRKRNKVVKLEKEIADLEKNMTVLSGETIPKFEKKVMDPNPQMSTDAAREKIKDALAKIHEFQEIHDQLSIRLNQTKSEIKAIEYEKEAGTIARDLPIPKTLKTTLPIKSLQSMKDAVNNGRKFLGLPELTDGMDANEDDDDKKKDNGPIAQILQTIFGGDEEEEVPVEKYFGKKICNPLTGEYNMPVLNRKNKDAVLKKQEQARVVTDIYLARTTGIPYWPRPIPAEKKAETKVRSTQQTNVDEMLLSVFATNPSQDLEEWSKDEARRNHDVKQPQCVFGSTQYPTKFKPEMEMQCQSIEIKPGKSVEYSYSKYTRPTPGKGSKLSSAGKATGAIMNRQPDTRFQTAKIAEGRSFELKNWGPDPGDQWALGKAFADSYGKQARSAGTCMRANMLIFMATDMLV
jgi:hypothetical protein